MRLSRSAAVSRTSSAPTCAVLPASCCSSSSSSLAAQPCSGSSTQMLRARGVSEGRKTWQHQQRQHGGRPSVLCRATLDDPDLVELLKKMEALRAPPSDGRPKLQKALQLIDEANSQDPQKVEWEGKQYPYRLLYSQWVSAWVDQLDSNGPDELYILARGRNVQGWKLTDIKRDDYAPNTGGMRQWEMDRKKWQAKRLTDIMKEAGYSDPSCKLAEDFILDKDIPNPRDMRKFDVVGTLGMINYRLLEIVKMAQVLIDADALVFVERSFPRMFANMNAEDVLAMCKREMSRISQKAMVEVLRMDWTPVQRKLLTKAFPAPKRYGEIMGALENVAAASTHPGDWRFRNFDYE